MQYKFNIGYLFRFNNAQASTRNPIERTFGYIKKRFSCLERRLDRDPIKAAKLIQCIVCLHNFAMERGDLYFEEGKVINLNNDVCEDPEPNCISSNENKVGNIVRKEIVSQFFTV